jgi:GDP-L-fucose synthase
MPQTSQSRIFVAGHRGLVGSAITRRLQARGLGDTLILRTRHELDLLNQAQVRDFFERERPTHVYLAAARVGGIHANNTYGGSFLYENLMIASNVIEAAHQCKTKKLLFLGSSCIYPKFAEQPIRESSLLTGALEPTNEAYAIAKIAGLKLCEYYRRQYGSDFVSAMPTNLYGIHDQFHPENSHVIPGLLRRFHEAKVSGQKSVAVWGTGTPKREFLFSDDLAEALDLIMDQYSSGETINVGTGVDCTIAELAQIIREVVGFEGELVWDTTRPDGTPRKVLDVSKVKSLGFEPKTPLKDGLKHAYSWAVQNQIFNR